MLFLDGTIDFTSPLDLKSVAAMISEHLFGGLPFVDSSEFDEVAGVRLEKNFMMFSVRICGTPPRFSLLVTTRLPVYSPDSFPKLEMVDLAPLIRLGLQPIDQISVITQ